MSLKGYQFLNDDKTKVIASYYFKDLTLYLYKEISDEKMEEIKNYLKDNGDWEIRNVIDFTREER